jgi:putative ABC transport system substrate-binding protein
MNRRDAVLALLALLALGARSGFVDAQPNPARLAFIGSGTPESGAAALAELRKGLRDHGLAEGKDYAFDAFWAEGRYDRFPALLEASLARKPAIILVTTIASARAAQQVTKSIPIVMTGLNDPVGSGLIASLARPGGNITGMATMNDDRAAKLVEFIREAMPKAKHLAMLINPLNPSNRPIFQSFQKAAQSAGMTAEAFEASTREQIDAAFVELAKTRPDALVTGFDSALVDNRARIVSLGMSRKIPVVSTNSFDVGELITFGVSPQNSVMKQSALYVKKILAGAKPADLPVQQPTNFELMINTKTAKALGLSIPQSMLLRADRLIE